MYTLLYKDLRSGHTTTSTFNSYESLLNNLNWVLRFSGIGLNSDSAEKAAHMLDFMSRYEESNVLSELLFNLNSRQSDIEFQYYKS